MDLDVHKAILYLAMKKSVDVNIINSEFLAIWAGNWMTDINQASCVLDMLPDKSVKWAFKDNPEGYKQYRKRRKLKVSAYNAYVSNDTTEYTLNPLLQAIEPYWINLISQIWKAEVGSTSRDYKLEGEYSENIVTFDLQKIGMYYPPDHFDVVEREDSDEYNKINENLFAESIRFAIDDHACKRLLKHAFDLRNNNKKASLFYLGRALHVLADFYAHSNFVYLILRCFAEEKKIKSINDYQAASWEHILFERYGATNKIPVLSGRFDKIDTIASMLKIYRNFLIPDFNDFKESILKIDKNLSPDERLSLIKTEMEQNNTILAINIIFGTFTNYQIAGELKEIVSLTVHVIDFIKRLTGEIRNEFLNIIDNIIEQEIKSTDNEHLIDFLKVLKMADPDDARTNIQNHLKAGKVMYYEYMIRKTLINNLFEQNNEYLPHHTLIANDSDYSHPVRRLEYKMACYFAYDVTERIIQIYYNGGGLAEVKGIIDSCYSYPVTFYDSNKEMIGDAVREMYGCRWWEYVQSNN